MKLKRPGLLVLTIFVSQLAGVVGSVPTMSAIDGWYTTLVKPGFQPPNYLFGPVWIALYFLMGIAWYLVWVREKKASWAVKIFGIHLVVNSVWSIVFFGLKDLGLALVVIAILWLMIGCLVNIFYKIDKWAGYLLLPYWAWVSFASMLNYAIWRLN